MTLHITRDITCCVSLFSLCLIFFITSSCNKYSVHALQTQFFKTAPSPKQGDLFGLYSKQKVLQLFKLDPLPAPVGPPVSPYPFETGTQLASIDTRNELFYVLALNRTNHAVDLIGISLRSGQMIRKVTLDGLFSNFGYAQTMSVDPNTGDVFIVSPLSSLEYALSLLKVSFQGNQSNVTLLNNNIYAQVGIYCCSLSAFESKTLIVSLHVPFSGDYLFSFDRLTGKLLNRVLNSRQLQTLAYDSKTGMIVGMGYNEKYKRAMIYLDSNTLEVKKTIDIEGEYRDLLSGGSIDVVNRKWYGFMSKQGTTPPRFDLVTIDMDTGNVVNAINLEQRPESLLVFNE
ncbi:hypothetical protein C9374_003964 [Naegleria lovaniensis]|uniref:Uncharacterized protein n=1 Tax=Naegleria lovaniensis TaxID=51637 RepID=A0AA88H410_NAELO|nr:uncharacterized protein C9374_003964 [Naegleria lovaniensis]KAG2394200.1 hypothetical protein C9374_003964 [Naegleria lovaniensis]